MAVSETQTRYLHELAKRTGPVAAQVLFDELRFSKLSLSRMVGADLVEKQMVDGRSHYRLTQTGIDHIAATRTA